MRHNLPIFDHVDAQAIEEACTVLSQHQEEARVIAGGTDLLVRMKYRASAPRVLVNLKRISDLKKLEQNGNGALVIGSLTSLHEIENSSLVRDRYPILSQASARVANRTIRNMGTLGGNLCQDARCEYFTHSHLFGREYWSKCFKRGGDLCHIMKKGDHCYARYSADTAPALIALDAKVKIVSTRGKRVIPVEDLFTGSGHKVNILHPDEVLTEVHIPRLDSQWKGVYLKHSYRGTTDYPIVGIAALANMEGNMCNELKVVTISVASAPLRMREVEDTLKGVRLSDSVIARAAELAVKAANPVPHHGDSPKYVREMLGVYTKKALSQLLH